MFQNEMAKRVILPVHSEIVWTGKMFCWLLLSRIILLKVHIQCKCKYSNLENFLQGTHAQDFIVHFSHF
jgi:hypothetical protein